MKEAMTRTTTATTSASATGEVPLRGRRDVRALLLAAGCGLLAALGAGLAPGADKAQPQFASAQASRAEYDRTVAPFFARHCAACHNAKKAEGDLDLATLDPNMKATTSGARWAMLLEKLNHGEMPPKGRPRPAAADVQAVVRWAHAEAKRAGKHFARRQASSNGNQAAHHLLFDPNHIPPFDAPPVVRRLSPEIYAAFTGELAKGKSGIGQPFSPEGKSTFKDMGAPRVDEPVSTQLLQNALLIVETQTAHKLEDGKLVKVGNAPRELLALFDPKAPPTDAQIEEALAYQFQTILRRPPSAEEKSRFVAFTKKNMAQAGQTVGARYALAAVLLLPEAIFRMEVGSGKPDAKGRVRLAPREIAYALAYALTDKRPGAELLTAAATGGLDSDAGVAKQVRRLLDDQRTDKPRILRFFREYFEYDQAREVFKDNLKEFGYDASVLIADTDALVLYVLQQDRDVLRELLTTNKSFVNARVNAAKGGKIEPYHSKNNRKTHLNYSLPADWQWTDRQPLEFPAEQRAGILTQPSWLVAHSTSFDNHAIRRGKWVRERLLGGVVPDLPITVDAQLPDAPEKTLRQRMQVTQQEYCWKCHRLMNDVGLPFEQYDHFGRFRTTEAVVDPQATAKNVDKKGKPQGPVLRAAPLDTTGLVAHVGDPALEGPVSGPIELLRKLAGSERVEQVFVRHAFRYWLGRNETPGDAATLQAVHRAYRQGGGSMKALLTALLSSESFLYRVPAPAEPKN
jgi:mono/diheme cytochrome c family protein